MRNRKIEMGEQNIPINVIYSQTKYQQPQQQQKIIPQQQRQQQQQVYFQNQTFSWR